MATKQILISDVQTEGSARKRKSRRNNNTMNDEIYESVPPSTLGTSFVQVNISPQEMLVTKHMSNLQNYLDEDSISKDNVLTDLNIKKKRPTYDIFKKYIKIESFIEYLMSILALKDLFSNDTTKSNYKEETSFSVPILKKHYKSSNMLKLFEKYKLTITVKQLIEHLISVQDLDRKGKHDEIFLSVMKLLGCTFDINKLPDYHNIKMISALKPYYNYIKPRFETKVLAYFKYRIYNEPLIKFVSSREKNAIPILQTFFRFNNQYKIKRDCSIDQRKYKFYDLGLEIKVSNTTDDYECKLLLEVQENSKGHIDNPNDDEKKILAIRKNMEIVYYRQHEYSKDSSSLARKYEEYFTYLQALLLNADIQCRREYLKFQYTESYKTHKEILDDELKICKDKNRITEINVALQNINRKIKSEDTLLTILNWKEQSQKAVDSENIKMHGDSVLKKVDNFNNDIKSKIIRKLNDKIFLLQNDNPASRVIALDAEFLDIARISEKKSKDKIIPIYTKNNLIKFDDGKYYVSWQSLVQIIGDYADGDIKATLLQYLTNVESVYERIIELKDFYQLFKDDLLAWKHEYELTEHKEDYSNEIRDYTNTIALTKTLNNFVISEYKDFTIECINFLKFLNSKKVLDKFDDINDKYAAVNAFKLRLEHASTFEENIANHFSKKTHKIKSNKYVFNATDDEIIYTNRPDVKIKYKSTNYTPIDYTTALGINILLGVSKLTFDKYIKECIDDEIELNEGTPINNLEIEQSLLDRYNNQFDNKLVIETKEAEKGAKEEAEEEVGEEAEEEAEEEAGEEAEEEAEEECASDRNSDRDSECGSDEEDELTDLTNID